ncbi:hypothetical protein Kpol_530p44 [Vanderwaltozyma polyspora DSM 70294]|uniref:Protein SDS23 n=1 Tax=Vanderwaltozyma polyspora (strain ATCC 22028 / DSM 70294 / BCRC 21397 / CBS 2163 / NBRC 10782 / NRRL Y-8283 / UCD 57-17) TaxID=436907 RepID=SDS23_VANPO|nr:uncharacterized protein Kpol_530p44 [Vanderwaltozyma polyspora DSM 70294]A7TL18.1 RecName: Full=Protein SDS23 [Vanderwaltozyma polyspora DSM 70294]EDO17074.1 hypothetical protein Kpol_530p44 [Vanderwaltozyma polyspora DSM 70294]
MSTNISNKNSMSTSGSNNNTNNNNNSGCSSSNSSQRHNSIVELLSTPPQLPHQHHFNKSRQNSNLNESMSDSGESGLRRVDSYSSNDSISILSINSAHNHTDVGDVIINNELTASTTASTVGSGNSNQLTQTTSQCISSTHSQKWQHIQLTQLIEQNKLITVQGSISIEEAFNTLMKYHLTSLPVESYPGDMNCFTFDYNDLNSYLLLVLNKITVNNREITQDCQNGKPVPVGEIIKLTPKNPFYKLPETENLSTVLGILGSGVHRVAITNTEMTKIKGILSQRRLIKYLWDNARSFPSLEPLFNSSLQELQIGVLNTHSKPTSKQSRVISIQGEEPLINALYKIHEERISSIAVVDHQNNLIGNISVTDVKYVTRTSQYPLLHNTCRHFISVILNTRGLEMGKDSFPIFHVYPTSSLARTLAKLVATKSHRLWIVQPPEPSDINTGNTSNPASSHSPMMTAVDHSPSQTPNVSPTNLFEKEYRTGKLIGVISLTDILSVLARKQTDNKQVDPLSARRQRGSVSM